MAVPKRKTSTARKGKRSAHHRVAAAQAVSCPNCSQPAQPHRVCAYCGQYQGKVIVDMEASEAPAAE